MADKEWYTQQEIAEELHVTLDRVRATVSTLAKAGVIRTQRDPRDSRYVQVHSSSIPVVRQTLGG